MPESREDASFVAVGGRNKSFLRRGAVVPRRRKKGRGIRVAILVLAVALSGVGLYRFVGSSLFSLQRIEVSGNRRVRTEEILRSVDAGGART